MSHCMNVTSHEIDDVIKSTRDEIAHCKAAKPFNECVSKPLGQFMVRGYLKVFYKVVNCIPAANHLEKYNKVIDDRQKFYEEKLIDVSWFNFTHDSGSNEF